MSYLSQIYTEPRKGLNFDNYFNSQIEIKDLPFHNIQTVNTSLIISGKSGSGVTHVLNALCNKYSNQNRKVLYITSQWLMQINKLLKTETNREQFLIELSSYDVVAIDNIQFLYRKSQTNLNFVVQLIIHCKTIGKTVLIGCSDPKKDITKSKAFIKSYSLKRIELRELSSYDVFTALKHLCFPEDQLPDSLLYAISGYNGMIQQHINCLISVRFNPLLKTLNIEAMSVEELDKLFNLKTYFPKQQFRKCFIQYTLDFEKKEKVDRSLPRYISN